MKIKVNWPFASLLVLFIVLALAYSIINPIFESPDEYLHYDFVRYLIDWHELPIQMLGKLSEYHQPPLYYALSAVFIGAVPVDSYLPQDNPFFGYDAYRFGVDNKVRYIHSALEAFPYHDTSLAVHLLRGFSILLGTLSLIVSFQALQEVFSHPVVVLGGVAFIAFNPQFIFVSSSISNDNLITLLGVLMTWLAIRVARSGMTRQRALVMAVLTAAAVLTKLSAAVLILIPVSAMLMSRISWRKWLSTFAIVAIVLVTVTGWWFLRNLNLYGEPTGVRLWQQIWGWQNSTINLSALGVVLQNLWTSYWGRFGLGQIVLPNWLYDALLVTLLLSTVGLGSNLKGWGAICNLQSTAEFPSQANGRGISILLIALTLLLAASIWYSLVNPAGTAGRFLFPATTAIGGLMAYGLHSLYRHARHRVDQLYLGLICGLMTALSLGSLIAVIAPAYATPDAVSIASVRSQTTSLDIRFGDAATLLGYSLDRDRALPGDDLNVKLCWRTLAATTSPTYFFIHFLGADNSIVSQRTSLHGLGRYPSVNWQPDYIFCDDVPVHIDIDTPAPKVYQVEVGMVDMVSRTRLTPLSPANLELSPAIIAQVKVRSGNAVTQSIPNQTDIALGQQIDLIGSNVNPLQITSGKPLTITLYWQAEYMLDANYTVFVHFRDMSGTTVAQDDSPPQAGNYPTSFWDAGEIVRDDHVLQVPKDLAAGTYRVVLGLYRPDTGERLSLTQNGTGNEITLPLAVQVR